MHALYNCQYLLSAAAVDLVILQAVEMNAPRAGSAPAFLNTAAANSVGGYGGYVAGLGPNMYGRPYGSAFNTGAQINDIPSWPTNIKCLQAEGLFFPGMLRAGANFGRSAKTQIQTALTQDNVPSCS